jgi:DNA-binding MarR family transcriptional regulator/GNAT superfamily N-acetyltransferase
MSTDEIDKVRRFNRAVTRRIGVLSDSYLSRGRPLGEARVLFEIGFADGIGLQALRERLGLDSGYLSRLMRSLERQGVVALARDANDARARHVRLTPEGEREYAAYDLLSDELASGLLAPLGPSQRRRMVAAMAEVERLLRAGCVTVALEPAAGAVARACLEQYYAELARRFPSGFDPLAVNNFDPAETTPPKGWFVVAWLDSAAVGCGALKRLGEGIGEVKRVWTAPEVRGLGVASRVMDRLEEMAAEAGFSTIRLDTNGTLGEAQAMYAARGYTPIPRYNDNPYAEHWYEKRLVD